MVQKSLLMEVGQIFERVEKRSKVTDRRRVELISIGSDNYIFKDLKGAMFIFPHHSYHMNDANKRVHYNYRPDYIHLNVVREDLIVNYLNS